MMIFEKMLKSKCFYNIRVYVSSVNVVEEDMRKRELCDRVGREER